MILDTPQPRSEAHTDVELERASPESAESELAELRRTVERLEEAVRSRDTVLSVVAHDLRNPLGVISIAANTLLQRLPGPSSRRPVERIIRSARRADRMVRDLLAISAIETGQLSLDAKPTGTADLIFAAVESQQNVAAEASIIIGTDLSPDVPSIQADEERILEVLENLIGNALKFTRRGRVRLDVRILPSQIDFVVSDTGIGIRPEDREAIFEMFRQADQSDSRRFGGTGLGLYIVRRYVEQLSGRIVLDSTPGEGSTFTVSIPRGTIPDATERAA
jgi:signal transduction histidine kinase